MLYLHTYISHICIWHTSYLWYDVKIYFHPSCLCPASLCLRILFTKLCDFLLMSSAEGSISYSGKDTQDDDDDDVANHNHEEFIHHFIIHENCSISEVRRGLTMEELPENGSSQCPMRSKVLPPHHFMVLHSVPWGQKFCHWIISSLSLYSRPCVNHMRMVLHSVPWGPILFLPPNNFFSILVSSPLYESYQLFRVCYGFPIIPANLLLL